MEFQLHWYIIEHEFWRTTIKRFANTIETRSRCGSDIVLSTSFRGKWWYCICRWFHMKSGRQNMCSVFSSGKPLNTSNLLLEFVQTTSLSHSSGRCHSYRNKGTDRNTITIQLLANVLTILRDVEKSGNCIPLFFIRFFVRAVKENFMGWCYH